MPTLPCSVCWFLPFSSRSPRTYLTAPRTRSHHARGTESSSCGHPQLQGRAQGGQGLLGADTSPPQQRGYSEGRSTGLGQKSRVAHGHLILLPGSPHESQPTGTQPCAGSADLPRRLSYLPQPLAALCHRGFASTCLCQPRAAPLPALLPPTQLLAGDVRTWPWLRTLLPGMHQSGGLVQTVITGTAVPYLCPMRCLIEQQCSKGPRGPGNRICFSWLQGVPQPGPELSGQSRLQQPTAPGLLSLGSSAPGAAVPGASASSPGSPGWQQFF